jgi:hypothetical protein
VFLTHPLRVVRSLFALLVWAAPALAAAPQYVDVTESSGIAFTGTYAVPEDGLSRNQQIMMLNTGNGAAVGDIDGDGDLDVYLLGQLGHENRLYLNNLAQGSKTFTDATPAVLADRAMSRTAAIVDLDNDGLRDIVLINDDGYVYEGPDVDSRCRVFRNDGDLAFTDMSSGTDFAPVGYLRSGLALTDYNGDGLIDLYVSNWCMHGPFGPCQFPGTNVLYRNEGGFTLKWAKIAGLDFYDKDSFSAVMADFDSDGLTDLYVAVDHLRDRYYRRTADGFTEESETAGVTHVGNDMGVACADFDNDGDLDLYTTNITDPDGIFGMSQGNAFYVNRFDATGQAVFVNEAAERGALNTCWGWGVDFLDAENDGDLDIVAATGFDDLVVKVAGEASAIYRTPCILFLNDGTGHFGRAMGTGLDDPADSRALIAFDYDQDGDQDLLVTNVNGPAKLYENVTPNAGHWLEVVLTPDHDAIGAAVYAVTGGTTRRRDVICGDSYLSGTPTEVHFGLGGAATVDALIVRWPDGTEHRFTTVAANQRLPVDHDGGLVPVQLLNLSASREDGKAVVTWEVPDPGGTAGFHAFRETAGGARERLTQVLLLPTRFYRVEDPDPPPEGARYWVQELSRTGEAAWHGPAVLAPDRGPGTGFRIAAGRPNPFREATTVSYRLAEAGTVRLTVLDLGGRVVRTLVHGFKGAGDHTATWDGRNAQGAPAAPGVYFLRLREGKRTDGCKVALLP